MGEDDYNIELDLRGQDYGFSDTFSDGRKDDELTYIQPVTMSIISSLGLIFNIIVIAMILILRDYKKTSHWYVLNLAMADSIFLISLPLGAVQYLSGEWKFGIVLCKTYIGMFYTNYYASIFFLAVMSFDRYVAILYPMSSTWRKYRSRIGSCITTIVIWLMAVLAALPTILNTKLIPGDDHLRALSNDPAYSCKLDFHEPNEIQECLHKGIDLDICKNVTSMSKDYLEYTSDSDIENLRNMMDGSGNFNASSGRPYNHEDHCSHKRYPSLIAWVYVNIIVAYAIPIILMVFCYGCILWRVLNPRIPAKRSSLNNDSARSFLKRRHSSSSSSNSQRRNQRVTVLVVSLVIAFIACWTPFQITNVLKLGSLAGDQLTCERISSAAKLVAYCSSMLNPLLYTFLGANFRKRIRKVLNKIRGRRTYSSDSRHFRQANSQGRGSFTTKISKSASSDAANLSHINMQLLPPYHKRERSMA